MLISASSLILSNFWNYLSIYAIPLALCVSDYSPKSILDDESFLLSVLDCFTYLIIGE
jgi:hypothetical protein